MTTDNTHKKNDRRKSWLVPTSSLFNSIFYPKQHRSNTKKQRSKSLDHGTLKKINETGHMLTLSTTTTDHDNAMNLSAPICTKKNSLIDKKKKMKMNHIDSNKPTSRKTPKIVEAIFSKAKKHPKLKRAATLIEIKAQHYMKSKEELQTNDSNDNDNQTMNGSFSLDPIKINDTDDDQDEINSLFYQPFPTKINEDILDKLQQKNDLIKLAFAGELTRPFDEDAIEKVLDIGCGPNLPWSIDFAASHPNAHVIGMDVLDKATDIIIDLPSNCELIKHNCIKPFPMEPNSIDLCHIRFMNTSFTMEQYKKVVENCWRVLKPGGYIEIMEMDTLVYSPGPMTELLNQQVMDKLRQLGFKPRLARMLKDILPIDPRLNDDLHITEFYRSLPIGVWGGRLGVLFRDDLVYALMYATRHIPLFSSPPHSSPPSPSITTTITEQHQYHPTSLSSTTTTPTNSIVLDQPSSSSPTFNNNNDHDEEDEDALFENQLLMAEKELEQCRSFSNFHFLRVQKPF